ncbi:MAG TPA: cytochrome c [Pyrinomonadaceae bacterium]
MRRATRRFLIKLGVVVLVLAAVSGVMAWYYLFREVRTSYASAEDNFKYGSLGNEQTDGIPYWIWLVLPRMFPEKLPGLGGYASFGLVWEEGSELPIGFSKKTIGFDRVAINCAFCHTATYRTQAGDKPVIVPGGPSHQFNPQAYVRFLYACASDPRFNADNIMREIGYVYQLSPVEKFLYRYVLIPQTKEALLKQKAQFAWMDTRPDWGRGRIDPFNPIKFGILKQPMDNTIGNSDMVPLWNLKIRQGMSLHWDGLNTSEEEVFLSSAIGDGATYKNIERENLKRMQDWLANLQPPKYPYAINQELVSRGQEIFTEQCASCHAVGGESTGKVIPVETLGTDRHRLDMWTEGAARAYNNYQEGYNWGFKNFHKTNGYVSVPLDGLWLRAPYLHNGSVPSLVDLLETPDKRPKLFWRGYDVYDQEKVGFISSGPEAEQFGFRYDTSAPGNSNQGHLWGVDLSPDDKKALIEFLKTQ